MVKLNIRSTAKSLWNQYDCPKKLPTINKTKVWSSFLNKVERPRMRKLKNGTSYMIRSSLRLAKMNIQKSRRVLWQGRLKNLRRWPKIGYTDGQRVHTTMTISSKTSWIRSTLKLKTRINLSDKTTVDQPNRCLKTSSKAKGSKTDQIFGIRKDKWVRYRRKCHKLCLL